MNSKATVKTARKEEFANAGELPALSTVVNGRDGRIWSQQRLYSHRFSPDQGMYEPALSTRRIDRVVYGREVVQLP